jgi:hypothetical protein
MSRPMARRHDDMTPAKRFIANLILFMSGALFVLGLDLALRVAG